MELATVIERSPKGHGLVKDRAPAAGILYDMKLVLQKLLCLRMWPVVYALFVVMALASFPDALADDERDYKVDVLTDIAAEISLQEPRWAFTKSVRVELAKSENLRLETTIPLDRAEEPRLTLGLAKKVSSNWSVDLSVWAAL